MFLFYDLKVFPSMVIRHEQFIFMIYVMDQQAVKETKFNSLSELTELKLISTS